MSLRIGHAKEIGMEETIASVSYTHLDVYKRQISIRLILMTD